MQTELGAMRKLEQSRKTQMDAHSSLAAAQAVHKTIHQAAAAASAAAGLTRLGDVKQTIAGLQNNSDHSQRIILPRTSS